MDDLHARLAAAGVGLFDVPAAPVAHFDRAGLTSLIVDVLAEGTASMAVTLPSLFVAQDSLAPAAVGDAADRLPARDRRRLGLLYRLARCLAASRRPDVEHYLGRRVNLPPWKGEPADLPDPAERFGDSCLREARDEEEHPETAGIAGDAERTFDIWLRILAIEGGAVLTLGEAVTKGWLQSQFESGGMEFRRTRDPERFSRMLESVLQPPPQA